jgi:hypothetical protein
MQATAQASNEATLEIGRSRRRARARIRRRSTAKLRLEKIEAHGRTAPDVGGRFRYVARAVVKRISRLFPAH